MLLDWYVRFRRIDEWPEATGTVLSAELVEGKDGGEGKSPDSKKIAFLYHDQSGRVHSGKMSPIEDAEFFHLDVGDTFGVRYNPKKPESYFVMGAHSFSSWAFATLAFFALLAAGIVKLILMAGDPKYR